jgi:protein SCO1/2
MMLTFGRNVRAISGPAGVRASFGLGPLQGGSMTSRLIAVIAGSLLLGIVAALILIPTAGKQQLTPPAKSVGQAQVGGPFKLVDQTGKTVTDADYRGRYMLVYFGYKYCPDVCPAGLQVMSAALDKLGPKAEKITPVFITLDPDRDTPAKLREYIQSFHPRFVALTGSADDIAKAAKAYRVFWKKVPDEKNPTDYTIDHSSVIYLMTPGGEYAAHFTHATNVDQMAAKLAERL